MAAVDSLLRLMTSQNAEGLILTAGQVPRLSKGGFLQPLSMPPVAAPLVEIFMSEVLPAQQIEAARQNGGVTAEYGDLIVTVSHQDGAWTMSFRKRPLGSAPAPRPQPKLVPASIETPPLAPPRHAATTPKSPDLDAWLARTLESGASDLLVSAGLGARLRVGGALVALPGDPLDSDSLLGAVDHALDDGHRVALERHGSTDLAFVWQGARFRVNLFRQSSGLAAAFRPVRREAPTLDELGLPATLERLIGYPSGLVLVTGPTGSGKSTTLVALIEQLNRTAARHIITLEDPIEFEYVPRRGLVHQRELGSHVDSFEAGLRAALREAPDVILVGEMRDRATIAAALTAAETGHLVLSTLHAASAAMAVDRIIDVFPEHQQRQVRSQLAGTLRAVLTQHLLAATSPGERVPAVELLIVTAAAASLIRDGKTHQLASAIQTGRDDGMIPLDRSLADRVEARQVTLDTALAVTLDGGAQLRDLLARRRT